MTSQASSKYEALSTDDPEAPSVDNSDEGHRGLKEADLGGDTDESKGQNIPSTEQLLATAVDVDETADAQTCGPADADRTAYADSSADEEQQQDSEAGDTEEPKGRRTDWVTLFRQSISRLHTFKYTKE